MAREEEKRVAEELAVKEAQSMASKERFRARAREQVVSENENEKDVVEDKEIARIKEQYLGKKKQKTVGKVVRSKFMFEWDAEKEDTSDRVEDTYQVQLAFGRGALGGMEREKEVMGKNSSRGKLKEEQVLMKSRHWTEKRLEDMNDRDWRIFNEDFNITTRGGSIPKPLRSWEEANLPQKLLQTLVQVGYNEPTPVQRAAIPIGRQNRDLMAIAETGSGKTVAFVIPMLVSLKIE